LPVWNGANYYDLEDLVKFPYYRNELAETSLKYVKEHYDVRKSAAEWEALIDEY